MINASIPLVPDAELTARNIGLAATLVNSRLERINEVSPCDRF